jgi:DNA-binding CsgD family transcriptional regulator
MALYCHVVKFVRSVNFAPDSSPSNARAWASDTASYYTGRMRGVGTFRTYSFRRELPAEWFDSAFYQKTYGSRGVYDAVFIGFPLNPNAESHYGFYSHERFTEDQIALFAYALRGIKWFHQRVMLSQGLLVASSPLTPAEQQVVALLLTKATEKQIADQLGLAVSTTHQHVVTLFRKFGVRNRAGLMSLWLNGL